MAISKRQIVRALGKARMNKVLEIDIDTGVIDIQLKPPYINTAYGETCWVFDFYFYDDMTNKEIIDDLLYFFSRIEECPEAWEE